MECDVVKKNLGLSKCNKLPALIRGMITTPDDFVLTETEAVDVAEWQAALLASIEARVYIWPPFVDFENISEPAIYEDKPLAYLAVRDGKYRFRFSIKQNLCLHKAMYTHRSNIGRVFLIDVENQIIGTEDDDGNIRGFSIQLLNTEKLVISDGSVSTKSPIVVALNNNKELDKNGVIITADFVDTLESIVDVDLTLVGTSTSSKFVVDAKSSCDGTPITGLVKADFSLIKASDGSAMTATTCTESTTTPGEYTLASSAAFVAGTINLVAANALSIQSYESTGAIDDGL